MELCSPSRMRKLFDTIPARIENSSASDARVFKDSIRILRQTLIKNVDIFVDGQFIADQKDMRLKWRGSSNQRVIDVKQSILNNKVVLYTA